MNLTIRGRLISIVLLSLLPTALLGYLFIAQCQKDIAFSAKELEGVRYYAALAPDLAAISSASALPPIAGPELRDARRATTGELVQSRIREDANHVLRVGDPQRDEVESGGRDRRGGRGHRRTG